MTRVHMLHFMKHVRHHSRKIDDFDIILFQIYWSVCANNYFNIQVARLSLDTDKR